MKFKLQLQRNYRLGARQLIAGTHLARNYWWRSWKTWMLCYCRVLGRARHARRSSIHLHRTSTLIAEICTYMLLSCRLKEKRWIMLATYCPNYRNHFTRTHLLHKLRWSLRITNCKHVASAIQCLNNGNSLYWWLVKVGIKLCTN